MRTIAQKAKDNVYYKARMSAAEYNDNLRSREGAAEALGLHPSTIADYELGIVKCPQPDKVLLMADLYNAPELIPHYCRNECPLGECGHVAEIEATELDRLVVRVLSRLGRAAQIKEDLIEIAEDGVIDATEEKILDEVILNLEEIAATAQELRLWALKRKGMQDV